MENSEKTVQIDNNSLVSRMKVIQNDYIQCEKALADTNKKALDIEKTMTVLLGKFQALGELGIDTGVFSSEDVEYGLDKIVASYEPQPVFTGSTANVDHAPANCPSSEG